MFIQAKKITFPKDNSTWLSMVLIKCMLYPNYFAFMTNTSTLYKAMAMNTNMANLSQSYNKIRWLARQDFTAKSGITIVLNTIAASNAQTTPVTFGKATLFSHCH